MDSVSCMWTRGKTLGVKMSNLWFNIRFGTYHWQWGPDGMTCRRNSAQVEWKKNQGRNWKPFAIYCVFGHHFF